MKLHLKEKLTAFNTLAGAIATITVVTVTGTHGSAAHYDGTRDVAFLNN